MQLSFKVARRGGQARFTTGRQVRSHCSYPATRVADVMAGAGGAFVTTGAVEAPGNKGAPGGHAEIS